MSLVVLHSVPHGQSIVCLLYVIQIFNIFTFPCTMVDTGWPLSCVQFYTVYIMQIQHNIIGTELYIFN